MAAIAIPSVAGLIDRANVSADDTNANEMTNAIERFTSEYELFCQDIASNKVDFNDLDAAQSRVYNVTGIENRDCIEAIEGSGLGGKKLNKDTKYPENILTMKSVVENYTKTSSATYMPKQSDMSVYYSPDCGLVVVSETTDTPDVEALNKLVVSGKDAKGRTLDSSTRWINLTTGTDTADLMYIHKDKIPTGAEYITSTGQVLGENDAFPTEPTTGDEYRYGDYVYKYNYSGASSGKWNEASTGISAGDWGVLVADRTKESYGPVLSSICGKGITTLSSTFSQCINLQTLSSDFKIPASVVSTHKMFFLCNKMEKMPDTLHLPNGIQDITSMFMNCWKMKNISTNFRITSHITSTERLFSSCKAIETIPSNIVIPNGVTSTSYMFYQCSAIKKLPATIKLPSTVTDCSSMFVDCNFELSEPFVVPESVTNISAMFHGTGTPNCHIVINSSNLNTTNFFMSATTDKIILSGTSTQLQAIKDEAIVLTEAEVIIMQ